MDKSDSAARLAAALSLAMNGLLCISVPQTNRNETRQINCGYPCSLARCCLVDLQMRHLFGAQKSKHR